MSVAALTEHEMTTDTVCTQALKEKTWQQVRGGKQKFTPQRNEIQNDGVIFLCVFFNVAF